MILKIIALLIGLVVLALYFYFAHPKNSNKNANKNKDLTNITTLEWKQLFKHFEKNAVYFSSQKTKCFNKIGGKPNLPVDLEWPTLDGVPLSFIAQIDISALPKQNGIIRNDANGALFVFGILIEDCYFGDEENGQQAYRVIYSSNLDAPEREFPSNLDCDATYLPTYLKASKVVKDIPNVLEDSFTDIELSMSDFDSYCKAFEMEIEENKTFKSMQDADIKFGGFPEYIQGCELIPNTKLQTNNETLSHFAHIIETNKYILLFQIKSERDKEGKMYIGDGGIIYGFIRLQDLINNNFNNIYIKMQCG